MFSLYLFTTYLIRIVVLSWSCYLSKLVSIVTIVVYDIIHTLPVVLNVSVVPPDIAVLSNNIIRWLNTAMMTLEIHGNTCTHSR